MVAANRARSECTKPGQHAVAVGPPRDEIAHEIHAVLVARAQLIQKVVQLGGAAVNVANEDTSAHGRDSVVRCSLQVTRIEFCRKVRLPVHSCERASAKCFQTLRAHPHEGYRPGLCT
jgi:hypothetical protein